MTYIMGKNRGDIIKTLKKTGDTILIAKAEIIYAIAPDLLVRSTIKELMREMKMQPKTYEYYRVGLIKITDIKEVEDEKPPSCEFYNIEYCDPCKSPNDITKCDLFQIGTQIKIEKWNPSEQEECSHESHFISTKTECEKCKEKE